MNNENPSDGSQNGGASASVVSGGNTAAPAQAAGHLPLPWSLVIGVYPGAPTLVRDADGRIVLQCPDECSEVDLANLNLIVAAVNATIPASASTVRFPVEAAPPSFTIHESHGDVEVQPGAGA